MVSTPDFRSLGHITRQDAIAELRRLILKYYFDKVYAGLEAQGWKQSINGHNDMCCFYDRHSGCRCAIVVLHV